MVKVLRLDIWVLDSHGNKSMILKNLISLDDRSIIQSEFDSMDGNVDKDWGEKNYYNLPSTLTFLHSLRPIVEEKINKKIIGVNTYMRRYVKGNTLPKHKDRKQLDVTLSIQINKSDDIINPLIIHSHPEVIIELENNGDGGIIFGKNFYHSRPELKSDWMYSLFLHYSYKTPTQQLI